MPRSLDRLQSSVSETDFEGLLPLYERTRTHVSLAKDAPEERPIQPAERVAVAQLAEVGGPHRRYERRAA